MSFHPIRYLPAEQAKERAELRRDVLGCRRCELRDGCDTPVPYHVESGVVPKFVIVGEAPGKTETARGMPFVGPSGKLLRALMLGAGVDPDDVGWVNTVQCWPQKDDGETRAPSINERLRCRENLERALMAFGSPWVLLVGAVALDSWRSDLKVTEFHGRAGIMDGRWVVGTTFHPAAALRTASLKAVIRRDLEKWVGVVEGDASRHAAWLMEAKDRPCVRCDHPSVWVDDDGLGFCRAHRDRYRGQRMKEQARWVEKPEQLVLGGELVL